MATATATTIGKRDGSRTLSILHLAMTSSLTAAFVFVLCWIGTLIPPFSPTHAYIALFTNADFHSARALVEGTCWSLLFGALAGGVFAVIFNATSSLERG